jgi:hypothetical protein
MDFPPLNSLQLFSILSRSVRGKLARGPQTGFEEMRTATLDETSLLPTGLPDSKERPHLISAFLSGVELPEDAQALNSQWD